VAVELGFRGEPGAPQQLRLRGPERWVLDFHDVPEAPRVQTLDVGSGGVRRVRFALHEGHLRVVMDLEAEGLEVDLQQTGAGAVLTVR
jgi:hypothetical protein